jgi:cell division protein FtsI (penicillin-binding protein 3)
VAAPVFRDVSRWTLNHLGVMPRLRLASAGEEAAPRKEVRFELVKHGAGTGDEGIEPETALLPDFRGKSMREVLREGRGMGLQVDLEGTGLAVEQFPEPGVVMADVNRVRVKFDPPI